MMDPFALVLTLYPLLSQSADSREVGCVPAALAARDQQVHSLRMAFSLEIEYASRLNREPTFELGLWHRDPRTEMIVTLTGTERREPLCERFVWSGVRGTRFKSDAVWADYSAILAGRPPAAELAEIGIGRRSGKLLRASTPAQAGLFHAGVPWSEYLARSDVRILGREPALGRDCLVLIGDIDGATEAEDTRYQKPFVAVLDDRETLLVARLETYEGWTPEPRLGVPEVAVGVPRDVIRTPDGAVWKRRTLVEVLEVDRLGGVWIGTKARFSNSANTNSTSTIRIDVAASALGDDVAAALLDDTIARGTRVLDAGSAEEYYEGHRGDAEYTAERRYGEVLRRAFPAIHAEWHDIEGRADDFSDVSDDALVLYTAALVGGARPPLEHAVRACAAPRDARLRNAAEWSAAVLVSELGFVPNRSAEIGRGDDAWYLAFLADSPDASATPRLLRRRATDVAEIFDTREGLATYAWDEVGPLVHATFPLAGKETTDSGPSSATPRPGSAVSVSATGLRIGVLAALLTILVGLWARRLHNARSP